MTRRESPMHGEILEHMSDGVLSVDGDGRIMTFNPAAVRLLGIPADAALNRTLAELFLTRAGFDDFNQAIIDAVQGALTGEPRTVEVRIDDAVHLFTLTTSYLGTDGDGENRGVIAVFADVTELKELRQSERRLAETLEAQHAELQSAYRELEEGNQTLATALRKVQIARVVATTFVIGLFVLVGAVAWHSPLAPASASSSDPVADGAKDGGAITVAPERLISTISVFGRLAPRREVLVTSPAAGKVAEAHFLYGERVAVGQQLLKLDTTEIEREHREALAAHINATKNLAELEDWANNPEMARVRRDLSKARLALDNQKNKLEQTALLLEQGIVSAAEHDAALRQYEGQRLDYELLERDRQTVLAKGDADAREVARLELENARIRVRRLEETLANATVAAPIAGVLLQPAQTSFGDEERLLVKGQVVNQGEPLFTIGDVEGLSVRGWVDEVDVDKIRLAQAVMVRGDAFPDLELRGAVTHVSRQARQGSARDVPTFEFVAAVEGLAAAERASLRLGMSATVEIVVADKPDALLVPISAVQIQGDETWLRVRDPRDGGIERRRVETGTTTLTQVEIVSGLRAGEVVLLAAAGAA